MTNVVSTANSFDAGKAIFPLDSQEYTLPARAFTDDLMDELNELHAKLQLNSAIDVDSLSAVRKLIRSAFEVAGSNTIDPSGIIPATERRMDVSSGGLLGWQCRVIEKLMGDRLGDKLKIDDMARAVRLSPSYFTRAFRTTYGMPPKHFLMRLRIREAQKCLLANQPPLCDLALQYGFSDQAHFTRVFHGMTGETPRRWLGKHLRPSSRYAPSSL